MMSDEDIEKIIYKNTMKETLMFLNNLETQTSNNKHKTSSPNKNKMNVKMTSNGFTKRKNESTDCVVKSRKLTSNNKKNLKYREKQLIKRNTKKAAY